MCFNDVKEIVYKDYQRFGAFAESKAFEFIQMKSSYKREAINWFDVRKNSDEYGIFVPRGLTEERIYNSAECRNEGRFPTVAYIN